MTIPNKLLNMAIWQRYIHGNMCNKWYVHSFYARTNVIFRKFHHCSVGTNVIFTLYIVVEFRKFHHCSASIKVNLIKTYCAPYCSQLWVNHTKCSYNKLRVAYNNAYRRVLGYAQSDSASNMFVNNQVENFDAHNRNLIYNMRSGAKTIMKNTN